MPDGPPGGMHPMDALYCEIERIREIVGQWAAASMDGGPDGQPTLYEAAGQAAGADDGEAWRPEPVQRFFSTGASGEVVGRSGRRSRIEVHNASDGTLLLRIDDTENEASLTAYTVAVGPGEHYVSPQGADLTGSIQYRWVTLPMEDPAPPAGIFLETTGGWLMYSETLRAPAAQSAGLAMR